MIAEKTKTPSSSLVDVALRIIRSQGEMSYSTLKSMPGVDDLILANLVAEIQKRLPVTISQRQIQSSPFLMWDKVIRLQTTGARVERAPG